MIIIRSHFATVSMETLNIILFVTDYFSEFDLLFMSLNKINHVSIEIIFKTFIHAIHLFLYILSYR